MKKRVSILLVCLGALGLGSWSAASEIRADALVPLPSVLDYTNGDGWGVALGLGIEYEPAYDGSDEYEAELDPAGALQWRNDNMMFFWEGIELGWRARVGGNWLLQIGARYEGGREEDDSDEGRLDGLGDTESETIGMLEIRRAIGEDWRNWIGGRIMSGDIGTLGLLAAGRRFGAERDGSGSEILAFATFSDSDFVNRDFGITAEQSANSGLPITTLDSGYRSFGIQLIHRRYLTDSWQLSIEAGVETYNGDIADSPLAQDDFEAELGISVVYRF